MVVGLQLCTFSLIPKLFTAVKCLIPISPCGRVTLALMEKYIPIPILKGWLCPLLLRFAMLWYEGSNSTASLPSPFASQDYKIHALLATMKCHGCRFTKLVRCPIKWYWWIQDHARNWGIILRHMDDWHPPSGQWPDMLTPFLALHIAILRAIFYVHFNSSC